MVDVTPGADREKASDVVAFLAGPESFDSFEQILERTVAFNPTRTESSLRRGILHNAARRDDGRWVWRNLPTQLADGQQADLDFAGMCEHLAAVYLSHLIQHGARSPE